MADYCTKAQVDTMIGFTTSDDPATRPTATQVTSILGITTGMINGIAKQTDITDTYGTLCAIQLWLIYKMINNIWYLAEPTKYSYMPVEFSAEEKKMIINVASAWNVRCFEYGE